MHYGVSFQYKRSRLYHFSEKTITKTTFISRRILILFKFKNVGHLPKVTVCQASLHEVRIGVQNRLLMNILTLLKKIKTRFAN